MKNNLSIRETILSKLMLSFGSKYSELEKDINNHDLFNYHLKELQKIGYVKKQGLLYLLTPEGRQEVALMEEDGSVQKPF